MVSPTIQTPTEPMLPDVPQTPAEITGENLKQVISMLFEHQRRLTHALREYGRAISADITLGGTVYPKTVAAAAANVLEDGLCMEYDGTRAYAWAKINGLLRVLTNLPQGYVAYATAIQNSAGGAGWGIETWTFPQGGFKAATYPTVLGSLEGTIAHMRGAGVTHELFLLSPPSATAVTFRIDELSVADIPPATLSRAVCSSNTVWIDALAVGEPK